MFLGCFKGIFLNKRFWELGRTHPTPFGKIPKKHIFLDSVPKVELRDQEKMRVVALHCHLDMTGLTFDQTKESNKKYSRLRGFVLLVCLFVFAPLFSCLFIYLSVFVCLFF